MELFEGESWGIICLKIKRPFNRFVERIEEIYRRILYLRTEITRNILWKYCGKYLLKVPPYFRTFWLFIKILKMFYHLIYWRKFYEYLSTNCLFVSSFLKSFRNRFFIYAINVVDFFFRARIVVKWNLAIQSASVVRDLLRLLA